MGGPEVVDATIDVALSKESLRAVEAFWDSIGHTSGGTVENPKRLADRRPDDNQKEKDE